LSPGAQIEGLWSVTFTVTKSVGSGMRPVGTVYGEIWTITPNADCPPNEVPYVACNVTVVSSSGHTLLGNYPSAPIREAVFRIPAPTTGPCPNLGGQGGRLTFFPPEADGRLHRFVTGWNGAVDGWLISVYQPLGTPPRCYPVAGEWSSVAGIRVNP
jgi:hypothetical protein